MKKSAIKRRAILDTAHRLFRAQGFDKASIAGLPDEKEIALAPRRAVARFPQAIRARGPTEGVVAKTTETVADRKAIRRNGPSAKTKAKLARLRPSLMVR